MAEICHLRKSGLDLDQMLRIQLFPMRRLRTVDIAFVCEFIHQNHLAEEGRYLVILDRAFTEGLSVHLPARPPKTLTHALEQSFTYSKQVRSKVERTLLERIGDEERYGESKRVINFCFDTRVLVVRESLGAQFYSLCQFLEEYVQARKSRKIPHEACVAAMTRYKGSLVKKMK